MSRRNLTCGVALALLLGLDPSAAVLAASLGPKVCRMACAGTASCCCNLRPVPPSPSGKDRGRAMMAGKLAPACPSQCAVASSGARTTPHAVSTQISAALPDLDPILSRCSVPERAGSRSAASCSPRAPPA